MPTDPRSEAPSQRVALRRAAHKGAYDRPTIDAILDATPHCHLGYVLPDGQPIVVPTLQARVGDHVVVHASSGGKLALNATGPWPVCLTVTIIDDLVLARSGFHHSANHHSVVVLGDAEIVADHDQRLAALESNTQLSQAHNNWPCCHPRRPPGTVRRGRPLWLLWALDRQAADAP